MGKQPYDNWSAWSCFHFGGGLNWMDQDVGLTESVCIIQGQAAKNSIRLTALSSAQFLQHNGQLSSLNFWYSADLSATILLETAVIFLLLYPLWSFLPLLIRLMIEMAYFWISRPFQKKRKSYSSYSHLLNILFTPILESLEHSSLTTTFIYPNILILHTTPWGGWGIGTDIQG